MKVSKLTIAKVSYMPELNYSLKKLWAWSTSFEYCWQDRRSMRWVSFSHLSLNPH